MVMRPRSSVFTDRGKERFADTRTCTYTHTHTHSCVRSRMRESAYTCKVCASRRRSCTRATRTRVRLNFPRARSLSARHDTSHASCADMHVHFAPPASAIRWDNAVISVHPVSFGTGSGVGRQIIAEIMQVAWT